MYQRACADMYKCAEIRKDSFSKFCSSYIWETELVKSNIRMTFTV